MLTFPASSILLAAALAGGVAYVRLERVRRPAWRIAGRILLLGAIWASPLLTSGPGPVQLALGLIVAFLGIRAASLAERDRRSRQPAPTAGALARELLTPRALLVERAEPVRRPAWRVARGGLGMAACAALLVLGDRLEIWRWSRYADDLMVFAEVAIGATGLHDALVGVAALGFKRHIRGLLDRPALSTSLSQFWGRRWNRLVQADLDRGFFRPFARRGGGRAGTMAAFGASGIMHAVAVLDAADLPLTAGPAARVMGFFLLHGVLVLGEQAVRARRHRSGHEEPPGRAGAAGRHAPASRASLLGRRVMTLTVFALLSPLLLDPFARVTHVHGRHLGPQNFSEKPTVP